MYLFMGSFVSWEMDAYVFVFNLVKVEYIKRTCRPTIPDYA